MSSTARCVSTLPGRQQPLVLVEDQLHVLVGAEEPLHQDVRLPFAHEVARADAGRGQVGFVDDREEAGVEAALPAQVEDLRLVADEDHLGDALRRGARRGLDGVGVVPRRHRHAPGSDRRGGGAAGGLQRCHELVEGPDRVHRASSGA